MKNDPLPRTREEGYNANLNGVQKYDCPYDGLANESSLDLRAAWQRGWSDADRDRLLTNRLLIALEDALEARREYENAREQAHEGGHYGSDAAYLLERPQAEMDERLTQLTREFHEFLTRKLFSGEERLWHGMKEQT